MNDSSALQFGPISSAAEGPLYQQVIAAVVREIASGRLVAGDMLPSVRKLSADLLVSVITIKRAYDELERAGVIYSRQGVGAFVAPSASDALHADALEHVASLMRAAIAAAAPAAIGEAQLIELLRTLIKEADRP